ncbi:hypothetical protein V6N12_030165 [Hibiscus sabdariffa]|uniref:Uncharacterized protein n=1 Tax=Hibiscus sabdariffa TaxID=183260 RepID=A0ABR2C042_9ROSI
MSSRGGCFIAVASLEDKGLYGQTSIGSGDERRHFHGIQHPNTSLCCSFPRFCSWRPTEFLELNKQIGYRFCSWSIV